MQNKQILTDKLIRKIKKVVADSIAKGNITKALAAISFAGEYLYVYNQCYTDDDFEDFLCRISNGLKKKWVCAQFTHTSKKILFYDGFGMDTRGVALMYLNALGLNGYDVIYITNKSVRGDIPSIDAMCGKYGFQMRFVDMSNYLTWTKQLVNCFENEKPRAAFFYTVPNDVSGILAFHMYDGIVDRFLIDLTDHAFWLGKSASDYFLGSRNMSAYLQHYQRKISKEKMIKLGVNLLVEKCDDHSGLPFNPEDEKYIFSGGSLYKTLGDPEKKYYKIVDHILQTHGEIKFLYAGSGDETEIRKIVDKYPGRAFHINERKDFYYLIEHSVFYLNTYPMFGGMMMKFSGYAHRLPITLKHGHDSDGLLLHQADCKIEYASYEELISDVDKLLSNETYLKQREELLDGCVITEERFVNNLKGVIERHKTDYEHEYIEIDTTEFRKEYYERFDYHQQMLSISKSNNLTLLPVFPVAFIGGYLKKTVEKCMNFCRRFK